MPEGQSPESAFGCWKEGGFEMASIGHIALAVAASKHTMTSPSKTSRSIQMICILSLISYLPDLDVIGFWAGIPYSHPWGHRGMTHSLFFACVIGTLAGLIGPILSISYRRFAAISILLLASHGLLDAMTTGGLGVEFFWPLSTERFFLPWRWIPASKIGFHFTDTVQLAVFWKETIFFIPFILYRFWNKIQ